MVVLRENLDPASFTLAAYIQERFADGELIASVAAEVPDGHGMAEMGEAMSMAEIGRQHLAAPGAELPGGHRDHFDCTELGCVRNPHGEVGLAVTREVADGKREAEVILEVRTP